jgi:hypothetical protein
LEGLGPLELSRGYDVDHVPPVGGGHFYASSALDTNSLLHASGYTWSTAPGVGGIGQAGWRDVVFLGSGPGPESIRLTFTVEATLASNQRFGQPAVGIVGATSPFFEWNPNQQFGQAQLWGPGWAEVPGRVSGLVAEGFDDYVFDGFLFQGTFHVDVPYDASLGGYYWMLKLVASVGAQPSRHPNPAQPQDPFLVWSETQSLHSVGLQSITDPDGNPLAVTFDSGLQFASASAVPEPASLFAWAGMVGLALTGSILRRRRAGR